MPFQIIRNDITRVKADAVVNSANPKPVIGRGTESAIYRAAGEELLLAERRRIGDIAPGDAVSTPAFGLEARYIIHTAGPEWIDGKHGEKETLRSCYAKSLDLAAELSCESIVFPMISSGIYGFPKDEALNIALGEIGKFLLTHEMDVTLAVVDRGSLQISRKVMRGIREYIDEHGAAALLMREYPDAASAPKSPPLSQKRLHIGKANRIAKTPPIESKSSCLYSPDPEEFMEERLEKSIPRAIADYAEADLSLAAMDLDKMLHEREDTFQERLFRLIDERGMTDPEVYKKANISRKVFSKIRCNPNYRPTKKTAVAFGIALELDEPAMKDLLSRAELAFSPSSKFDLIILYFISQGNYNIYEINTALFEYGQELLGY